MYPCVSSPLKEWVRFQQAGIDQNENVALCRQQARNGRAFDSVQCPEFEDGGCDGCPGAGDFEILPPVPFSSSSTLSLSGVALLSSTNRVELSGTQRGGQLLHEVLVDPHIGERAGSSACRRI